MARIEAANMNTEKDVASARIVALYIILVGLAVGFAVEVDEGAFEVVWDEHGVDVETGLIEVLLVAVVVSVQLDEDPDLEERVSRADEEDDWLVLLETGYPVELWLAEEDCVFDEVYELVVG